MNYPCEYSVPLDLLKNNNISNIPRLTHAAERRLYLPAQKYLPISALAPQIVAKMLIALHTCSP
jgi:hypothetical protein